MYNTDTEMQHEEQKRKLPNKETYIYVRIKMTFHYAHRKLRLCNESILAHFCWSDPHKICCIELGIFSEIKFEI